MTPIRFSAFVVVLLLHHAFGWIISLAGQPKLKGTHALPSLSEYLSSAHEILGSSNPFAELKIAMELMHNDYNTELSMLNNKLRKKDMEMDIERISFAVSQQDADLQMDAKDDKIRYLVQELSVREAHSDVFRLQNMILLRDLESAIGNYNQHLNDFSQNKGLTTNNV
jgi:hypothetical protein